MVIFRKWNIFVAGHGDEDLPQVEELGFALLNFLVGDSLYLAGIFPGQIADLPPKLQLGRAVIARVIGRFAETFLRWRFLDTSARPVFPACRDSAMACRPRVAARAAPGRGERLVGEASV